MNEQSGNTAPVPPSPDDVIGRLLAVDYLAPHNGLCRDAAAALRREREARQRAEAERDELLAACELALERIDHIGCKNCGTDGRPSPCASCAEAIATVSVRFMRGSLAAIDAARGKKP